jgi:hypothetical protein
MNLWRLLVGAGTDLPAVADRPSAHRDSGNGQSSDRSYQWVPNTSEIEVRSDADGELFV